MSESKQTINDLGDDVEGDDVEGDDVEGDEDVLEEERIEESEDDTNDVDVLVDDTEGDDTEEENRELNEKIIKKMKKLKKNDIKGYEKLLTDYSNNRFSNFFYALLQQDLDEEFADLMIKHMIEEEWEINDEIELDVYPTVFGVTSPLHYCCEIRNKMWIKILVENGADVSYTIDTGNVGNVIDNQLSPINVLIIGNGKQEAHYQWDKSSLETVIEMSKYLINKGADPTLNKKSIDSLKCLMDCSNIKIDLSEYVNNFVNYMNDYITRGNGSFADMRSIGGSSLIRMFWNILIVFYLKRLDGKMNGVFYLKRLDSDGNEIKSDTASKAGKVGKIVVCNSSYVYSWCFDMKQQFESDTIEDKDGSIIFKPEINVFPFSFPNLRQLVSNYVGNYQNPRIKNAWRDEVSKSVCEGMPFVLVLLISEY